MDGRAWLNPKAEEDESRLLRGGSWDGYPMNCRSALPLSSRARQC